MTTGELIGEMARERDRYELDLSDAFDVKASIVLLILTFLGTISATILTADKAALIAKLAQIPVIASVVISGMLCVVCLWPKDYLLDDFPETYSNWAACLGLSDSEQLKTIADLSLQLAHKRIAQNHQLNSSKAWYLNRAFWSLSVGLFAELASVAYIAFATRPS
jgi:hypothetical protein